VLGTRTDDDLVRRRWIVCKRESASLLLRRLGQVGVADDPGVTAKVADIVENGFCGINGTNQSTQKTTKSAGRANRITATGLPRFQFDIGTLDILNAAPVLYPLLYTLLGAIFGHSEVTAGRGVNLGHFG
jgi:hypothetical protein